MERINTELKSYQAIYRIKRRNGIKYFFWILLGLALITLFLPWTQNVKARGTITTLQQENRTQHINALIPGRIKQWFVREGQTVRKGDTIVILEEIKAEYLDPNLIDRSEYQVAAKQGSISNYNEKIGNTQAQISNLQSSLQLKQQQLRTKIAQLEAKLQSEREELKANNNELELLQNQYERNTKMYNDGLISQTQLQQRNIQYQNSRAKKVNTENKIFQTQQDIANAKIEINSAAQEYSEKINKLLGEQNQYQSDINNAQAEVAKLENQISNYQLRSNMYVITAPQDGQIIQANKSGIGEVIKEGEILTKIVPQNAGYAVELFVRPMDLPLIYEGQKVMLTLDGYPAIVFSGWPEGSYGVFPGRIVTYETSINANGMFRVLVEPAHKVKSWPANISIGAGAQAIVLFKDVPVWYEIWRNINGFPAEYYQPKAADDKSNK